MSHLLYLVRHGIAEPNNPHGDGERRLTDDGVRKLREGALGLKRLGVVPDVVLSSPLCRAEQTARILATALAADVAVEIFPPLAPGHRPIDVLHALRPYRRVLQAILVGHQPDLGELASHLLTGSTALAALPFRKGGVAAIALHALPPRESGTLEWFVTPKQLRWMAAETAR